MKNKLAIYVVIIIPSLVLALFIGPIYYDKLIRQSSREKRLQLISCEESCEETRALVESCFDSSWGSAKWLGSFLLDSDSIGLQQKSYERCMADNSSKLHLSAKKWPETIRELVSFKAKSGVEVSLVVSASCFDECDAPESLSIRVGEEQIGAEIPFHKYNFSEPDSASVSRQLVVYGECSDEISIFTEMNFQGESFKKEYHAYHVQINRLGKERVAHKNISADEFNSNLAKNWSPCLTLN